MLCLRNLKYDFRKVNKANKRAIYYNNETNNMIIFNPVDKETDVNTACNSISHSAYDYLIDVMNNKTSVIVVWSQIEGTTSDYDIFYDYNPSEFLDKNYKSIVSVLYDSAGHNTMKYNEIKDGIWTTIKA